MNGLLNTLQQFNIASKTPRNRAFKMACACLLVMVLSLLAVYGVSFSDMNGWNSGFTHPLHGGDHFLTMIAVGVWAAQLRGKAIWLLPVTFVSVMSLGGLAGASGLFIPIAELLILASCIVFTLLIVRKVRFSSKINVAIVAFFAFFHGFAHGQEISTSASLISYTLGFMVATLLLHGAGILIVKLLVLLFALLISQIVYAHHTLQQGFVKTTAIQQIHQTHEQLMVDTAPPPLELDVRRCQQSISSCSLSSTRLWLDQRRIVQTLTARVPLWFDNAPQLAIRFLTNGVGVTAPPVAVLYSAVLSCVAPVVSSADFGNLVFQTNLYLVLIFSLATSFLSSGVGATSPPMECIVYTFLTHHCLWLFSYLLFLPFLFLLAQIRVKSRELSKCEFLFNSRFNHYKNIEEEDVSNF